MQLYDPSGNHTKPPVTAADEAACCGVCAVDVDCIGAELYGTSCYVKTAILPLVKQVPPPGVPLVACVKKPKMDGDGDGGGGDDGGGRSPTSCSKLPTPDMATCGYGGLPAVSFKGGPHQPVAAEFIPPWYHWAAQFNADGSAGPDGGTLPESGSCGFKFNTNRDGGDVGYASWTNIPYPGSQPYSMPQKCAAEAKGSVGRCARLCCAYVIRNAPFLRNGVAIGIADSVCLITATPTRLPRPPSQNPPNT